MYSAVLDKGEEKQERDRTETLPSASKILKRKVMPYLTG